MSAFYGTIEGQRGPATRCGSRQSGIRAAAQSWDGSVIVNLSYNESNELVVQVNTSENSSAFGRRRWLGTFEDFKRLLDEDNERKEWMAAH